MGSTISAGPRASGQEMALREMVRFRFTPTDDSSFLHVGLCGVKCSVYNISGGGMSDKKLVHYDPIQGLVPGYSAYVSKGPTPSSGVSSLFRKYAGARGYPPGVKSHDFRVMRYTRDDFILWYNNNPVFTQSIFTTRDRTKLWVESNTGTVEFGEDLVCGA